MSTLPDTIVQESPSVDDNSIASHTCEDINPSGNHNAEDASTPTETEENISVSPSRRTRNGHKNIYVTVLPDSNLQESLSLADNNVACNTSEDLHPNNNGNTDDTSTTTEIEENRSATLPMSSKDGNKDLYKTLPVYMTVLPDSNVQDAPSLDDNNEANSDDASTPTEMEQNQPPSLHTQDYDSNVYITVLPEANLQELQNLDVSNVAYSTSVDLHPNSNGNTDDASTTIEMEQNIFATPAMLTQDANKNVYVTVLLDSNAQESPNLDATNVANNISEDVQPNINDESPVTEIEQDISATPSSRTQEYGNKNVYVTVLLDSNAQESPNLCVSNVANNMSEDVHQNINDESPVTEIEQDISATPSSRTQEYGNKNVYVTVLPDSNVQESPVEESPGDASTANEIEDNRSATPSSCSRNGNTDVYVTVLPNLNSQQSPSLNGNNATNNHNIHVTSTATEIEDNRSAIPLCGTQDGNSMTNKVGRFQKMLLCVLLVSFLCVMALSTTLLILVVKNKTTQVNNTGPMINSSRENKSSVESIIWNSYREVRSMMLKDLPNVKVEKERDAANATTDYVHCFCLHQDLLYLLLTYNDTIAVYNYNNFSLWKVIEHKYLSKPTSVHPHTEHHLLVACSNGLLRMTTEGQDVEMINRGHFFDVNVHSNVIAALGNGGVWIYTNTMPLKLVTSFRVERQTLTKILIVGDLLYITCQCYVNSSIEIYNMTGDKIAEHNHFKVNTAAFPDYYNIPSLRGSDKEGTVLVLGRYWREETGTYFTLLKILDHIGNWKILLRLSLSYLFQIRDIVITDNREIVVMHWNPYGGMSFTVMNILSTD